VAYNIFCSNAYNSVLYYWQIRYMTICSCLGLGGAYNLNLSISTTWHARRRIVNTAFGGPLAVDVVWDEGVICSKIVYKWTTGGHMWGLRCRPTEAALTVLLPLLCQLLLFHGWAIARHTIHTSEESGACCLVWWQEGCMNPVPSQWYETLIDDIFNNSRVQFFTSTENRLQEAS